MQPLNEPHVTWTLTESPVKTTEPMRISITEMDGFQICQQKWDYSHRQGLRYSDPKENADHLQIGRAVASGVEHGIMKGDRQAAEKEIRRRLGKKLQEKGQLALDSVPDEMFSVDSPISEDKLVIHYGRSGDYWVVTKRCFKFWDPQGVRAEFAIVGIPDLWYVERDEEGEVLGVIVDEFKTSADAPSKARQKIVKYEQWGIQAVRYAVLLNDAYPQLRGVPFYRRHMLFTTRGESYIGRKLMVTEEQMDNVRGDMIELAQQMRSLGVAVRTFGPICSWCDFAPVCMAYLTNDDEDEILSERYEKRVRRT